MLGIGNEGQSVIRRAAESAMGDRAVRREMGVGVLGWLFAVGEIVKLIMRLIELYQESRTYPTPRVGYEATARRLSHADKRLVGHLYQAELGGFLR